MDELPGLNMDLIHTLRLWSGQPLMPASKGSRTVRMLALQALPQVHTLQSQAAVVQSHIAAFQSCLGVNTKALEGFVVTEPLEWVGVTEPLVGDGVTEALEWVGVTEAPEGITITEVLEGVRTEPPASAPALEATAPSLQKPPWRGRGPQIALGF